VKQAAHQAGQPVWISDRCGNAGTLHYSRNMAPSSRHDQSMHSRPQYARHSLTLIKFVEGLGLRLQQAHHHGGALHVAKVLEGAGDLQGGEGEENVQEK